MRRLAARLLVVAGLALATSCGDSPGGPSPQPPPPPPPDPINLAPVIRSIQVSAERAEVDTQVTLTAVVEDAETAVPQLRLEWRADAGTITGEGLSVQWRAPREGATPREYTIGLTVTEIYGTAGANGTRPQHVVTAQSPAVRVHDSPKELGDLSLRFLNDFATSSVLPATCVQEFSQSCRGRTDELNDIIYNREHFVILGSVLNLRSVRVASDTVRADMSVGCSFTSRATKCEADDPTCRVGSVGTVRGNCRLTGVYEQKRWWLCTSNFDSESTISPAFRSFFGRPQ